MLTAFPASVCCNSIEEEVMIKEVFEQQINEYFVSRYFENFHLSSEFRQGYTSKRKFKFCEVKKVLLPIGLS